MAEPATSFTPGPVSTITAQAPFSADFHIEPAFDLLEILPPAAAAKLRMLRQRAVDAHAIIPEFETIREASATKIDAENRLRRLQAHAQDGGFGLPPEDSRCVAAERHRAKVSDDLRRLQERSEARAQSWQSASGALSSVEQWLKIGKPSGVLLQDYDGSPPTLNKGDAGLLDAIENRRRRVREIKASIHAIQSSCFPRAYCKERMRASVEARARAPDVSNLIEFDRDIIWPSLRLSSQVLAEQRSLAVAEVTDTLGLFAWLHKDALIAALDREIDAESDDAAALSHEARQTVEAEVMGDLLSVERDESFFVWQAQAQGLPCEHRSDCSPIAILNLALIAEPRATELPASSPERASYNLAGGRR